MEKNKRTKKIVFIVILFILITIILFIINDDSPTGNVKIKNIDINTICEYSLGENNCSTSFYSKPKVELNKLNNTVTIRTETDCCIDFEVESVNKIKNQIIIGLIERGKDVCKCGSNLQEVNLQINETIDINNLEIYQTREYLSRNKKIKIY